MRIFDIRNIYEHTAVIEKLIRGLGIRASGFLLVVVFSTDGQGES